MADKDSWWSDTNKNSGESTINPFSPRDTQNDGSSFSPKSVTEGADRFGHRTETADRKNINEKRNR